MNQEQEKTPAEIAEAVIKSHINLAVTIQSILQQASKQESRALKNPRQFTVGDLRKYSNQSYDQAKDKINRLIQNGLIEIIQSPEGKEFYEINFNRNYSKQVLEARKKILQQEIDWLEHCIDVYRNIIHGPFTEITASARKRTKLNVVSKDDTSPK